MVRAHAPRILIADGNTEDRNQSMVELGSKPSSACHAFEIQRMFPKANITVVYPAYGDDFLPAGVGLSDFDGMVMGGSGLHVFDQSPEVTRQVDLMRSALEAGLPVMGSCWGLQVAAAATGGSVAASPRGREVGIARKVSLLPAGRGHQLYENKRDVFDSPCIHYDEVTHLPAGAVILASNAHSAIQAATIRHGQGMFWGMQYHPEFDLAYLSALYRRYADDMIGGGFFRDRQELDNYVSDLDVLHQDPSRHDLRWRLGIDDDVLDPETRCTEIRNWVESLG